MSDTYSKKVLKYGFIIFAIPFLLFFLFMGSLIDVYIVHHPSVLIVSIPMMFVTLIVVAIFVARPLLLSGKQQGQEKTGGPRQLWIQPAQPIGQKPLVYRSPEQ